MPIQPPKYTIRQEIEFERYTSGRYWRATIEWEISIRCAAIETPVGTKLEYDAEIICGPTIEDFTLYDDDGEVFADQRTGNFLPDYLWYIRAAIHADIDAMKNQFVPIDWEERAVAEAIERHLDGEGQGEAEGIGRDGGKVVAR